MSDPSVENVAIIIDNKTYSGTFNEPITSAGCNYSIVPISLKKNSVFHPKVFLMISPRKIRAVVGSANLSLPGIISNAEICNVITTSKSECDEGTAIEECLILQEIIQFFQKLSSLNNEITNIVEYLDYDWVTKKLDHTDRKYWFLHTFDEPLIIKISKLIKDKVNRIKIISPYFDRGEMIFFNTLRKLYTEAEINVYFQKNACSINLEKFKKIFYSDSGMNAFDITFDYNRYLHGKTMIFECQNGSYCFMGSANASTAAFCKKATDGNVEAGILEYNIDNNHFNDIFLKSEGVYIDIIKNLDDIIVVPQEEHEWKEPAGIQIKYAEFKHGDITINYKGDIGKTISLFSLKEPNEYQEKWIESDCRYLMKMEISKDDISKNNSEFIFKRSLEEIRYIQSCYLQIDDSNYFWLKKFDTNLLYDIIAKAEVNIAKRLSEALITDESDRIDPMKFQMLFGDFIREYHKKLRELKENQSDERHLVKSTHHPRGKHTPQYCSVKDTLRFVNLILADFSDRTFSYDNATDYLKRFENLLYAYAQYLVYLIEIFPKKIVNEHIVEINNIIRKFTKRIIMFLKEYQLENQIKEELIDENEKQEYIAISFLFHKILNMIKIKQEFIDVQLTYLYESNLFDLPRDENTLDEIYEIYLEKIQDVVILLEKMKIIDKEKFVEKYDLIHKDKSDLIEIINETISAVTLFSELEERIIKGVLFDKDGRLIDRSKFHKLQKKFSKDN